MRTQARKAFTLVEILIVVVILGILAAIVVPQFTSASEEARASNLNTQLSSIRQQIELYRVRNNGQYPDFDNNGWDDIVGDDYLRAEPVNPYNNLSDIGDAAAEDVGWVWDGSWMSASAQDDAGDWYDFDPAP